MGLGRAYAFSALRPQSWARDARGPEGAFVLGAGRAIFTAALHSLTWLIFLRFIHQGRQLHRLHSLKLKGDSVVDLCRINRHSCTEMLLQNLNRLLLDKIENSKWVSLKRD